MPENHDNQNKAIKIWINAESQESHVCIYDFRHGNPDLMVLTFLSGYGINTKGVGGPI